MGVVALDVGILGFADFVEGAFPQVEGVGEDVGLAAQGERLLAVALARVLERVAQAALDALACVDRLLDGDLVGRASLEEAAGAGVEALGVLADDDEVDLLGSLVAERRVDAGVELDRAQVDVEVELEAQAQQDALLEDAGLDVGVADGAEQDGVEAA